MVSLCRFGPMLTVFACLVLPIAGRADEAAAIQIVEKLGGKVFVDDKRPGKPVVSVAFYEENKSIDAALQALSAFEKLDMLTVGHNFDITETGINEVNKLKSLGNLRLGGSKVSDMDLKHIKALSNLQYLDLSATQVTDAGRKEMKRLIGLKSLILISLKVTSAGLRQLKESNSLELLDLRDTRIVPDYRQLNLRRWARSGAWRFLIKSVLDVRRPIVPRSGKRSCKSVGDDGPRIYVATVASADFGTGGSYSGTACGSLVLHNWRAKSRNFRPCW
jgi:hypothetical protein